MSGTLCSLPLGWEFPCKFHAVSERRGFVCAVLRRTTPRQSCLVSTVEAPLGHGDDLWQTGAVVSGLIMMLELHGRARRARAGKTQSRQGVCLPCLAKGWSAVQLSSTREGFLPCGDGGVCRVAFSILLGMNDLLRV